MAIPLPNIGSVLAGLSPPAGPDVEPTTTMEVVSSELGLTDLEDLLAPVEPEATRRKMTAGEMMAIGLGSIGDALVASARARGARVRQPLGARTALGLSQRRMQQEEARAIRTAQRTTEARRMQAELGLKAAEIRQQRRRDVQQFGRDVKLEMLRAQREETRIAAQQAWQEQQFERSSFISALGTMAAAKVRPPKGGFPDDASAEDVLHWTAQQQVVTQDITPATKKAVAETVQGFMDQLGQIESALDDAVGSLSDEELAQQREDLEIRLERALAPYEIEPAAGPYIAAMRARVMAEFERKIGKRIVAEAEDRTRRRAEMTTMGSLLESSGYPAETPVVLPGFGVGAINPSVLWSIVKGLMPGEMESPQPEETEETPAWLRPLMTEEQIRRERKRLGME